MCLRYVSVEIYLSCVLPSKVLYSVKLFLIFVQNSKFVQVQKATHASWSRLLNSTTAGAGEITQQLLHRSESTADVDKQNNLNAKKVKFIVNYFLY